MAFEKQNSQERCSTLLSTLEGLVGKFKSENESKLDSISSLAKAQAGWNVESIQSIQADLKKSVDERHRQNTISSVEFAGIGGQANDVVDKGIADSKSALEKIDTQCAEDCDVISKSFVLVDQESRASRDYLVDGLESISAIAHETHDSVDGVLIQMKEKRDKAGHLLDGVLNSELDLIQQAAQTAEQKCGEQNGMLTFFKDSAKQSRQAYQYIFYLF